MREYKKELLRQKGLLHREVGAAAPFLRGGAEQNAPVWKIFRFSAKRPVEKTVKFRYTI